MPFLKNKIVAFAIFICFFCLPSLTSAATFGYTTAGGSETSNNNLDHISACLFTPAEAGDISSMSIYGRKYGSNESNCQLGIYSDSSAYPDARLAYNSTGFALPASSGWNTLNFSYSFSASTPYWLGWGISNGGYFSYDAGDANQMYRNNNPYEGQFPNPFPAGKTAYERKVSVYATYATGGAASHRLLMNK